MGPSRAERRRENFILWHILIISILLVIGLWGFFGVLPSPNEMASAYWHRVYWESENEAAKVRALERIYDETGTKANRAFSNAERSSSAPLRRIAARWFAERGVDSTIEPSW